MIHGHLHEGAFIGYPLSRLARVPLVFDFQGSLSAEMVDHGFLRPNGRLHGATRRLEATINRLADAVVTSTAHGADLLRDAFGCPARRITVVPDGVNVGLFRPPPAGSERVGRVAALRERIGLPPAVRVVVYLGLLAEYQGISRLLHAAQRVVAAEPDVHFLLLGYPGQDHYRAQADALGIGARVHLPGRVPYEEGPRLPGARPRGRGPKDVGDRGQRQGAQLHGNGAARRGVRYPRDARIAG